MPTRYAVILSAFDEDGYAVWAERRVGGDYVLGRTSEASLSIPGKAPKRSSFTVTHRGWFTDAWAWSPTLCIDLTSILGAAEAAPGR
ncbi:hypothetical protein DB346_20450 [Verrucomicrobia bacterium LW23]|nr:hypothetical protein DB346_20450 [Verrucomicrobia bacterium LW23]